MSRLPNASKALVEDAKIRDYLLNPDNPQNRGKAQRFGQYGFTRENWPALADSLSMHPTTNMLVKTETSRYGTKYVVECNLLTPDGRNPCMKSVWIIAPGEDQPRLVTAY